MSTERFLWRRTGSLAIEGVLPLKMRWPSRAGELLLLRKFILMFLLEEKRRKLRSYSDRLRLLRFGSSCLTASLTASEP